MIAKVLKNSLALANQLLSQPKASIAFSGAAHPLQINLPPLGGSGIGGSDMTAEALNVLSSLYFQAEMEQAAVIPLAELLTESRYSLQVTDHSAAQLLEQFADGGQNRWLNRQIRDQIYARTFGIGGALLNESGSTINRNFESLFARYCQALMQFQADSRWAAPGVSATVQVEMAAQQLLSNLGQRRFGNTLTAAQRIQGQLQAALDLLNHQGITGLFQANNIWSLIRNVLENDAPDLQRIVSRAQSGLRLISWLAQNLVPLRTRQLDQALTNGGEVFIWAASWLQATGMPSSANANSSQAVQNAPWPGGYSNNPHGNVFSATALLRESMANQNHRQAA